VNAISPLNRTWNVPAYSPALPLRPAMGYDTDPKPAFIDSALVSLLTDLGAAIPLGLLGLSYHKASKKESVSPSMVHTYRSWSAFFWAASGAASFKVLIDLSRIRTR
jgi:hypothetical protein